MRKGPGGRWVEWQVGGSRYYMADVMSRGGLILVGLARLVSVVKVASCYGDVGVYTELSLCSPIIFMVIRLRLCLRLYVWAKSVFERVKKVGHLHR